MYLLHQQDPEGLLHNLDMINLIPCELDITPTTFLDTTIITYEIVLPTAGKKFGFNLLYDEDFTIPYVIYKIPNSPASCQHPTQAKENVWIISINV